MSENKNVNSAQNEGKQTPTLLKEVCKAGATNNKFLDEASKKTRDITPLLKNEGGVQTRYPKEAGALTGFSKVCMRSNRNDSLKEIACDQGNKFKPDNHVQTLEVLDEGSKINEQNNSLSNDSSSDDNKRASLQRVRNFGRSNCQLRTRGFKNSKRDSQNAISSNKKLDKCNSFTNGLEGQNLAGDDLNFKTGQKSIKNLVHSKSKEEQANSENCDSENKELNKEKLSTSQKEKICQNWIKYLNKLENQMNIEITQPVSGESIPEFCTNKSCPISEFKIPRTLKIQKLAKKVILRKVFFQNSFERWYCLKCMKAHNDSCYCYYCGQIYFNEDDELESDGKAWICCDDCNKWIHLDCDILTGKNNELKKHYKDEDFKYLCPCCKSNEKQNKKRYSKDLKKKQDHSEQLNGNKFEPLDSGYNSASNSPPVNGQKETFPLSQDDAYNGQYYSQNVYGNQNNSKFDDSESYRKDDELDGEDNQQNGSFSQNEQSDNTKKKNKQSKRRITYEKARVNKRSREEVTSQEGNGYQSIEQFTYLRSVKLAKEREDIVEPRTLFSKVFATIKIQDRIQQDVELYINQIMNNISLDSEATSNSPQKEQINDRNGLNDLGALKLTDACMKPGNKTDYSKRLRDRRNKKMIEAHN